MVYDGFFKFSPYFNLNNRKCVFWNIQTHLKNWSSKENLTFSTALLQHSVYNPANLTCQWRTRQNRTLLDDRSIFHLVKWPPKCWQATLRNISITMQTINDKRAILNTIARVWNDRTRILVLIQAERDRNQTYINKGLNNV